MAKLLLVILAAEDQYKPETKKPKTPERKAVEEVKSAPAPKRARGEEALATALSLAAGAPAPNSLLALESK